MNIFSRKLKGLLCGLALFTVAGFSSAGQVAPELGLAPSQDQDIPASVGGNFESKWASIKNFIDAHKVSATIGIESLIKLETSLGVADWLCIGEGLGWPAALNSTLVGWIVFDTAENADYCAHMILSLASEM